MDVEDTIRRWKKLYSISIILIMFMLISNTSSSRGLEIDYTVPDDGATSIYLNQVVYIVFNTSIPADANFTLTDNYGTVYIEGDEYITTDVNNDTVAFTHSRWDVDRTYNLTIIETTTNTTYTWTFTTQNFGEYSAHVVIDFWLWTVQFMMLFLVIVIILSVVKSDGVINNENTKYK